MSRVSNLILETERQTAAQGLPALVRTLASEGLSRYQYLAAVVEVSSAIARLRGIPSDTVFSALSSLPPKGVEKEIDRFLEVEPSRRVA